jgi:type VI secretion system secreted protein Hcp
VILLNLGGKVKGDSVVAEHADWITCSSFQLGASRAISLSGGGKDRETSKPNVSEVVLTKSSDIASTELFSQALSGKSLGKAEIHFLQTADDKMQVYLIYELTDAIVSSFTLSSGGDRPMESISLNFTQILMTYNQFSGTEVTPGAAKGWDLMESKRLP